ncbi:MAG: hypothetical protein IT208_19290 [Chthonomonadales bacterium]|nr:hypothetical protein [Chthonomonadales bacterium]
MHSLRTRASLCASALLGLATLAGPAGGGLARQAQQKPIRFGDIVISNFVRAEFELGNFTRAVGPNTTVDAVDPRQNTRARIQAQSLTAYLVPKTSNRVDRIEATGNVRFSGTRAVPGGGTQTVRATGTRGVYNKLQEVLTLEGPVTFSARQPAASGSGQESVEGSAAKAVYDGAARVLTLSGKVQATVVTPDTPAEGSSFSGDEVRVEMASRPYKVIVHNPSLEGKVNIRLRDESGKE